MRSANQLGMSSDVILWYNFQKQTTQRLRKWQGNLKNHSAHPYSWGLNSIACDSYWAVMKGGEAFIFDWIHRGRLPDSKSLRPSKMTLTIWQRDKKSKKHNTETSMAKRIPRLSSLFRLIRRYAWVFVLLFVQIF
jgi:hypothetical protein